ncbi:hypothetical protein, conserved [Plasmodium gonderi]|uniref:Enkurin domain-containing protein n=1 Tax=Plasmodium gonderi TaxID=77519 RepID=A0A1Y1JJW4_PLAGO|nr:hypothetical protein, conserved [Plasmodium gonderi]GAW80344.1 hypothetical protein, conserved [Plasmodium gonderi]
MNQMNNDNLSENVRKVLAKKQRKKLKEEQELYKATKAISTQNNAQRKINAQNQLSSSSFVGKIKDINKSFPHMRNKDDKNYMKENRKKIQEKISLQKKLLEEKEKIKNKKPFKMKKFQNATSKVAKNLQKMGNTNETTIVRETHLKQNDTGVTSRLMNHAHEKCQQMGAKNVRAGEVEYEEGEEGEYEDVEGEEYEEVVGEEYEEVEGEEYEEVEGEEYEEVEGEEYEEVEGEKYEEMEGEEYEEVEGEEYEEGKNVKCEEDDDEEVEHEDGDFKNEKREDTVAKRENNIIDKLKKRESELRSKDRGKRENLHKSFGKLPSYILKKKKDVIDESADIPEGYRILKHDERKYVLKELHSQLTEMKEEYKKNKDNEKKIELGKKLKEIKESIELFSNPHVIVNQNF